MKKFPPAAGYHQYTLCLSQIVQLDLPIKLSWLISCLCVSCLRRINPSVNIQPVSVEDRSLNKIAQPHRVVNALHGWDFGHFQGFQPNSFFTYWNQPCLHNVVIFLILRMVFINFVSFQEWLSLIFLSLIWTVIFQLYRRRNVNRSYVCHIRNTQTSTYLGRYFVWIL